MKIIIKVIAVLLVLISWQQINAQGIIMPSYVSGCPGEEICFDVDIDHPTGLYDGYEFTLTDPNGNTTLLDEHPVGISAGVVFLNSPRKVCFTFEEEGVYTYCESWFESGQAFWWTWKRNEITECVTIDVGNETFERSPENFCTGDIFSWCPGDWGLDEMVPPMGQACDPGAAEPDENGCIEFEVCTDYEGEIYSYTVTREACDGTIQTTEFDIEFGGGYCIDEGSEGVDDVTNQRSSESARLSNEMDVMNNSFKVKLSPNPTSNVINIKTSSSNYDLTIRDGNGKLLEQFKFSYDEQVDVSDYIPGMYILIFNNGKETSVQKVLVN